MRQITDLNLTPCILVSGKVWVVEKFARVHPKGTCHYRTVPVIGNHMHYASYRMVSLSMTLSDSWPGFQGRGSFKRRMSPKRHILQTQLLYRTLIGNHRQAIDRQASYTEFTTPLLLHKPCKHFASVARVCQRQLAFLVFVATGCFEVSDANVSINFSFLFLVPRRVTIGDRII